LAALSAIEHKRTGCAVFAPNYRLMPENDRIASVKDCKAAYHWILGNGPDGPGEAEKLAIIGDSAGGNLTLTMAQWARDNGVKPADAIVGLSPATDSTFSSPSIKRNFGTDLMLRPLAAPLLKIPKPVLALLSWKQLKIRPAHPVVSPLRGNLADLPPTLLQVSFQEMMFDDSARYVTKAKSQGGDATLQSWSHMCHVWHIFDELLPEADQAFDEITAFLKTHGVTP